MKEEDFLAVDQADKRTDVELFQARKLKSQLNSGVAICDIEEVQDRIKQNQHPQKQYRNSQFNCIRKG